MAKVTSPLFSMNASGTHAGIITFTDKPSGAVAKKWSKPSGMPNGAQTQQRVLYMSGVMAWNALSPSEKASWEPAALLRRITAFNAYMSAYLLGVAPPPEVTALPLFISDANQSGVVLAVGYSGSPDAIKLTTAGIQSLATWDNNSGLVDHAAPQNDFGLDITSSDTNVSRIGILAYTMGANTPYIWSLADGFIEIDQVSEITNQYIAAVFLNESPFIVGGYDGAIKRFYWCILNTAQTLLTTPDPNMQTDVYNFTPDGEFVVGTYLTNGHWRCAMWVGAETMLDMGIPDEASDGYLYATSYDTTFRTGKCYVAGVLRAFYYDDNIGYSLVPLIDGSTSNEATSITLDGTYIAGTADLNGTPVPFIYSVAGGLKIIPLPSGFSGAWNIKISNNGTAISFNSESNGYFHPMLYRHTI
jgi:hypothetical protein